MKLLSVLSFSFSQQLDLVLKTLYDFLVLAFRCVHCLSVVDALQSGNCLLQHLSFLFLGCFQFLKRILLLLMLLLKPLHNHDKVGLHDFTDPEPGKLLAKILWLCVQL